MESSTLEIGGLIEVFDPDVSMDISIGAGLVLDVEPLRALIMWDTGKTFYISSSDLAAMHMGTWKHA